ATQAAQQENEGGAMLTNTFCHIPGIGEKTERNLWSAGVTDWDCVLRQMPGRWVRDIQESVRHYHERNPAYFGENLPTNQNWRLYWDFRDNCAFVDIETTGLFGFSEITTITLYDGRAIRCYVNGDNLDEFPEAVQEYSLLVTYNGKSFDVP